MGLLRRFKSLFNKDYQLINIEDIKKEDLGYTDKKERFFEIARNYQEKYNLKKKDAMKGIHDIFRIKDIKSGKIKSSEKTVEEIIEDFNKEQDVDIGDVMPFVSDSP